MHPFYSPLPELLPAVFERDVLVNTTLAMRGGSPDEFGILYRTFQRCEVRTWAAAGENAPAALLAWVRVDQGALRRVLEGDITVLDELGADVLHGGPVVVVCETWTAGPRVVYRFARELAKLPGAEWLVGRRGPRWRAHRVGGGDGTVLRRQAGEPTGVGNTSRLGAA